MKQTEIINALVLLGDAISEVKSNDDLVIRTNINNNWYTPEMQMYAFNYWKNNLNFDSINSLISAYNYTESPKRVGLVMAGNLPLVGLHDLICILVSGHYAKVKTSSDDIILTPWVIQTLFQIDSRLKERIEISDKLNNCEALIATGSNNTARYFNYYFKDVPRIIRKNRHSIAVLNGHFWLW